MYFHYWRCMKISKEAAMIICTSAFVQNKQITYPLNPDFALTNVNTGIAITEIHKTIIEAATFITPDDLNVLLTDNTITTLSLTNLSLIYRDNLLMQSLSFSANDLRIATQIIPVDVFSSPINTMEFLSQTDLLNNAGFSVWDVNYILRQQNDINETLIPADASITSNLGELQDALLVIKCEHFCFGGCKWRFTNQIG